MKYETHEVGIIQKLNLGDFKWYQVQYCFEEGSRFITHDYYVSTAKRFELQTEFFTTGKITLTTPSLFTYRQEEEIIEPKSIRFLPIESTYVKTPAMIMIPSVLEPRMLWTRSDFDSWNREATEAKFNLYIEDEELYNVQIEIAQKYGMTLKAH